MDLLDQRPPRDYEKHNYHVVAKTLNSLGPFANLLYDEDDQFPFSSVSLRAHVRGCMWSTSQNAPTSFELHINYTEWGWTLVYLPTRRVYASFHVPRATRERHRSTNDGGLRDWTPSASLIVRALQTSFMFGGRAIQLKPTGFGLNFTPNNPAARVERPAEELGLFVWDSALNGEAMVCPAGLMACRTQRCNRVFSAGERCSERHRRRE
ncbi:hypothetical protein MKEN_00573800 [Mycena kentingensis (nom. inval.)]|nr:hypothetical protein MKEN_00573800 [Mycena kentingensis (nom. inval.)]